MEFDQSDWIVTILLVILGLSVLIATVVIAKTFIHEAKEKKASAARLAEEEKKMASELQTPAKAPAPAPTPAPAPAPAAKASEELKSPSTPAHKDDVNDGDDLVAAAEVYLTYELKEQAITSLEKHLLTNPTDEKALALLKKAEASN